MSVSWGDRWRSVLQGPSVDMARRVRQGVATYRSGRVSDVRIGAGRVTARVQGSRATPFLVEVEVPVLSADEWDVVVGLLASRVRYSARLLAAQHPDGLAEEAEEQGVRLFPSLHDIAVSAGHSGEEPFPIVGAAVWEAVAVRLDASPFPLLKIRGRGRERIMRDIARRRRASHADDDEGVPVSSISPLGWSVERASLDAISIPAVREPVFAAPGLQVLGDPEGWAGALSAAELLGPLVSGAAGQAKALLRGEQSAS